MAPVRRPGEPPAAVGLAGSAFLVVAGACVDYATGVELRVFPLYFLSVLAISLRLGRWPGLGTAAACALAWALSNHLAGMRGGQPAIVMANLVIMAIAFGSVALLAAAQRDWLRRERAISRTDGLTGRLNGRGFYEAAAVELARSTRYRHPVTVAYVDLDDFKKVNDRLGHARGDAVLVAVAHALRRASRSTDLRSSAEVASREAHEGHGEHRLRGLREAPRRRRGAGARGRHRDVRREGGQRDVTSWGATQRLQRRAASGPRFTREQLRMAGATGTSERVLGVRGSGYTLRAASGARFTRAQRAGGLGGATQHPPEY